MCAGLLYLWHYRLPALSVKYLFVKFRALLRVLSFQVIKDLPIWQA